MKMRRRRLKNKGYSNQPQPIDNAKKSLIIELDEYTVGNQKSTIIRIINDKNKEGHLGGIPLEAFGVSLGKGNRYKISCEEI